MTTTTDVRTDGPTDGPTDGAGLVAVRRHGDVVVVTMDDGRVNALSPALLTAVGAGLDHAEVTEAAVVVLAGRPGRFSAGFDLGLLMAGGAEADAMVRGGFELAERLLGFPVPVVIACTGHAVAMGSFLLCAADLRIGATGEFRIQANEVHLGIPVPGTARALLGGRLSPAAFDRAAVLGEAFDPEAAVAAGWLDRVVAPDEVVPAAVAAAQGLCAIDRTAHTITKSAVREPVMAGLRAGMVAEFGQSASTSTSASDRATSPSPEAPARST